MVDGCIFFYEKDFFDREQKDNYNPNRKHGSDTNWYDTQKQCLEWPEQYMIIKRNGIKNEIQTAEYQPQDYQWIKQSIL